MSAWTDHVERWKDCTECPLCEQRDRICIARGKIPADVVFVGEAPGASEDAVGLPFVGPAGHLLDQIIERAIPANVRYALTNLVCCFPREAKESGDNEPENYEITACRPRLMEFIEIARPKLVITVGTLASWFFKWDGGRTVSIDHPAYILRMPLAQKQMATQRAIVVVRNAVAKAMDPASAEPPPPKKRFLDLPVVPRDEESAPSHDEVIENLRAREDWDTDDIPF